VGFAAETDDVEANAAAKLARKPVDLLVVNDVSQPGAGFESDTNEVRIMSPSRSTQLVDQRDKRAVARAVLDAVVADRATPR
jgi:phosphopantothenoylcysteine decarboxylase/phosphopantothenate--cysteine ligase